jgi:hypothetical protein
MHASNKIPKRKHSKSESASKGARLDIVFGGPLLFVPVVGDGNVTNIEIYSPRNGHPIGATFLPDMWFSDTELNDPECERWPDPRGFSLLDPHSYAIDLTQRVSEKQRPFPISNIPETNHRVRPGRRLSGEWEVAITLSGRLSGWDSHRLSRVTDDLYMGGDAPTTGTIAAMHRLTYAAVITAEFCGAPKEHKEYLKANIPKGGSLIIIGEVPYQPTLLHERRAIDALARLAGLDLHLAATDPQPHKSRLMNHIADCGHSIIVA